MRFWGIEVKPGNPHTYRAEKLHGILHITQATLGLGTSMEKSILQCTIGLKSPIFLCSLRPHATESCPLNLELDNGDFVTFSIIGARSIHLSGYFALDESDIDDNDKISSGYKAEDEYVKGFTTDDGDIDMCNYPTSPASNKDKSEGRGGWLEDSKRFQYQIDEEYVFPTSNAEGKKKKNLKEQGKGESSQTEEHGKKLPNEKTLEFGVLDEKKNKKKRKIKWKLNHFM